MDEEISISISLPLDRDGFLRRECPKCEQQFKWFSHQEGDPEAESVGQYFCPLCGAPSGIDTWWTPAQLEYAEAAASPELDQHIRDLVTDSFKGMKGVTFKPDPNFRLDLPTPDPITESDDMVIVEAPCHPNEPLKIPDEAAAGRLHCLICGTAFAV